MSQGDQLDQPGDIAALYGFTGKAMAEYLKVVWAKNRTVAIPEQSVVVALKKFSRQLGARLGDRTYNTAHSQYPLRTLCSFGSQGWYQFPMFSLGGVIGQNKPRSIEGDKLPDLFGPQISEFFVLEPARAICSR